MEQIAVASQADAELQNLELAEHREAPIIPEEPKKPAAFAANALEQMMGPVRDRRTILLSELTLIRGQRANLKRQLDELTSQDEDKQLQIMELEAFLAECEKISALSPSVEPYIRTIPPGSTTQKSAAAKTKTHYAQPEFTSAECLGLFESEPFMMLSAREILERIAPSRGVTMLEISNRLMYLSNQRKIMRVMTGVYKLAAVKKEEAPAAVISEPVNPVIEIAQPLRAHAVELPAPQRLRGRPHKDASPMLVLPHLSGKHTHTALSSPPPAPQVHAAAK